MKEAVTVLLPPLRLYVSKEQLQSCYHYKIFTTCKYHTKMLPPMSTKETVTKLLPPVTSVSIKEIVIKLLPPVCIIEGVANCHHQRNSYLNIYKYKETVTKLLLPVSMKETVTPLSSTVSIKEKV